MVIAARQEFFLAQSLDITNGDQKALLENIDDAMNVLTKLPQTRVVGGQGRCLPVRSLLSDGGRARAPRRCAGPLHGQSR